MALYSNSFRLAPETAFLCDVWEVLGKTIKPISNIR